MVRRPHRSSRTDSLFPFRMLFLSECASAVALAAGMLVAAAVMLLGVGFLPGFSLAVPMDQSLPLALIIVQSVVFAGMFLLLFRLQKIGGPVLLSLLDRKSTRLNSSY